MAIAGLRHGWERRQGFWEGSASQKGSSHKYGGNRSPSSSFEDTSQRRRLPPPNSPTAPPAPAAPSPRPLSASAPGRTARATMEHGSLEDSSASTFSIMEEDHTLANSVRFVLNQDPRVAFCGYSIPHPSENKVNIRLQTTGDPAKDVLKDSLQDLMVMCQHIRGTFDTAVADFRGNKPADAMDIDLNKK
ncbi:DNA-directed RNA polymerases I and III subunit RPAC2-like isoform X1 [Panicum virgatum]|nr:DNA-directed RNA polymerases I and III subunit RPAC2-like isoform X1 [Panicum virgatum]